MKKIAKRLNHTLFDVAIGPSVLIAFGVEWIILIAAVVAAIVVVTVVLVRRAKKKKAKLAEAQPGSEQQKEE